MLLLWLTEAQAEALLQLCAAAPPVVAETTEAILFGKLGDLLRAHRR